VGWGENQGKKKSKTCGLRQRQFHRTEEEGNNDKEYTKQVRHNTIAHHPLTDAQTVPDPQCAPGQLPPNLYAEHDVIRHGTSLRPVWVSCPVCVPSQFLVQPQLPRWQGSMRSWKVLDCLATTKMSVCYQHYSHPKWKA